MTENQACPLDLDYEDTLPVGLSVAAIEREGVRIRRRRRVGATAAALAVGLGIATGVATLRPSIPASPAAGTDLKAISQILAQNPPMATPVVISTWPSHWTTVGWATANGQYCSASFRTPAAGTFPQSRCESNDGDLGADGHVGDTVGMPLPAMAPMEDKQTYNRPGKAPNLHAFIGVTRAGVARVEMTAYGQSFTADTIQVTAANGTQIGIYQIWFATPTGAWNSTDIQAVVAYDAHGIALTRQGPWTPPAKPAG
ncbi:MAG: hypothetical protein ACJ786_28335 [Catenulispora sp.]